MSTLAAFLLTACVGLAAPPAELPAVAIIIDDIGYDYANSAAAIAIDKPLAYAILPFSPHARRFAESAHAGGKDILVHLPMEAEANNDLLGPGALLREMSRGEVEDAVAASLAAVPHAIGINNHMGSRLTREGDHMTWLMRAIHARGDLFFIDSRTTAGSVALDTARRERVASAARDVFLDNVRTKEHIYKRLIQLAERARRRGRALAIAHPHAVTVNVLRHWDATNFGVRIVDIRAFLAAGASRPNAAIASESAPSECREQRAEAEPAEYPHAQR